VFLPDAAVRRRISFFARPVLARVRLWLAGRTAASSSVTIPDTLQSLQRRFPPMVQPAFSSSRWKVVARRCPCESFSGYDNWCADPAHRFGRLRTRGKREIRRSIYKQIDKLATPHGPDRRLISKQDNSIGPRTE
jgi:hypothetical protein